MNRLWLACFCALGFSGAAQAQVAQVLSGGCGTAGYSNTKGVAQVTQDTTGATCVTVSTLSNRSPTDRSGTITLGGLAQTLMAANSSRHGCTIQNQSSFDLWIVSPGTASAIQPSTWLPAGSYYTCPSGGAPTGAISIFGATTGQAFAAGEW